ncbi:GDP-mannose 4,6-dehydratase, partial [Providencia huaxiensis]|uniref:GDP-mannose 4,6-dehydratase n=2 Tax=Morganellaceae TaxID=1903414 RepID=UPI0034E61CC4
MRYLVTGVSGFIGNKVTEQLLKNKHQVIGIDNNNSYYDVNLKLARLENIRHPQFTFIECDLSDKHRINEIFAEYSFDYVIHLGAQAGVRYSIENPHAYADSNLV